MLVRYSSKGVQVGIGIDKKSLLLTSLMILAREKQTCPVSSNYETKQLTFNARALHDFKI